MKCKNKLLVNCVLLLTITFLGMILVGCNSVSKVNFVQPTVQFIPGKILFSEKDIYINFDHVEDSILGQQIFQNLEPRICKLNLKSNPNGVSGHLVLTVNQRSFWEGYHQKNSIAITGTIYTARNPTEISNLEEPSEKNLFYKEPVIQQTILITGKDSMLKVKDQKKYIVPVVSKITKKWLKLKAKKGQL